MSEKKFMEINDLTYSINAAVFEVNRELGPGFLEKAYENALLSELASRGLKARNQVPITRRLKLSDSSYDLSCNPCIHLCPELGQR